MSNRGGGIASRFLKSGFNENIVANNIPVVQGQAIYNFVPSNFREFTAASGSTGAENRMLKVETGTSVGGYGAIQSFRSINYQAGESCSSRFTAIFESSAANSWQGVGLISIGDELSFGFNGTSFGVWHRHQGLAEVRTLTVTGAAGGSESLTLTLNGTAYTIPLTAGTEAHNAYEIADWLNTNQSVWNADQLGDTVIIAALSDGAKSGAYSFSSSTATGTIAQNTEGATKTSDFTPQAKWNGESVDWLDPTKGNVYEITYAYLGFGDLEYKVKNPNTGDFQTVHRIPWPNNNTQTNLGNPSLRCGMYAVSLGSTTNLVVRTGSFAGFIQGYEKQTRNPRAVTNTQSVSTSYTNILTVRNRYTYNSYANQIEIEPKLLSIASESGKNVQVEIRATTDPGVEQNFQNVGTNLISDFDTSAVTVTGGRLLASFTLAAGDSQFIDLEALQIRVPPTLHIVVQARVTSGASASVSASLTWYEDI